MSSAPAARFLRWLRALKAKADGLAAQANRLAERSEDIAWMIGGWKRNPEVLPRCGSASAPDVWAALKPSLDTEWELAAWTAQGAQLVSVLWQSAGAMQW